MNIFSNIGITELVVILLLALLVVGPERLPELAEKLGKTLRDVRKAYENLTRDLGPELTSIQKSTQELRESVESVRSIPQDMVKSIAKAADMDDTIEELKGVTKEVGQIGQTLTDTKKVIQHPLDAAVSAARSSLSPTAPAEEVEKAESEQVEQTTQAAAGDQETASQDALDAAVSAARRFLSPAPSDEATASKGDQVAARAAEGETQQPAADANVVEQSNE
jgi:Tat protein translocase TatB subunit